MSDIKIFDIKKGVKELKLERAPFEDKIESLIAKHMESFFNVRYIKRQWAFPGGRIDSIGIDENNSPVIFEYKRSKDENVINQGLFYLDWLMDHQGDFKVLLQEAFGTNDATTEIDWSNPTVVCVANEFSKFDTHAVNQISRNIRLVKYYIVGDDFIVFEHINSINPGRKNASTTNDDGNKRLQKPFQDKIDGLSNKMKSLYEDVCTYIIELGDDISQTIQKHYVAFKKVGNVACIVPNSEELKIYLKLSDNTLNSFKYEDGFTRDVRETGHLAGGCDLEIRISNQDQLEKAKSIIRMAYDEN